MRQLILLALLTVGLTVSASSPILDGVWKSGKFEMTFINDTLLIDEIDIEGDEYTYTVDYENNIINVSSEFTDTFSIKIVKLTKDILSIYYIGDENKEVYTFKRKKIQVPTMGY